MTSVTKLVDLKSPQDGMEEIPNQYQSGSHCIKFIFTTWLISKYKIIDFDEISPSDHRGIFINIYIYIYIYIFNYINSKQHAWSRKWNIEIKWYGNGNQIQNKINKLYQ